MVFVGGGGGGCACLLVLIVFLIFSWFFISRSDVESLLSAVWKKLSHR